MTMWKEVARAAPRSAFLQISAAPSPLKGSVWDGVGALTCGMPAAVVGRSLLQPAVSTATVRKTVIVATRRFIGSHPCGGLAGAGHSRSTRPPGRPRPPTEQKPQECRRFRDLLFTQWKNALQRSGPERA